MTSLQISGLVLNHLVGSKHGFGSLDHDLVGLENK